MPRFDGAVYIDSPISAAVCQVAPFFRQGVFSDAKTPLFMRRRIGGGFGLTAKLRPGDVKITPVGRSAAGRLPVRRGGAVFYPFNGQGNLHTVANRSYRHVLVLHGESNKRASARPAARLYDYVCVAGDLAVDRYLAGGIFQRADVDRGRLIRVGDTFVQSLGGYRADPGCGEAILYAPTWEGYGGAANDYSTVARGGLDMAEEALRQTCRSCLVIRPHPYLGLLRPGLVRALVNQACRLSARYRVLFDLQDANKLVRSAVRLALMSRQASAARDGAAAGLGYATGRESLSLCLCDISAMEAICLKARLPHLILAPHFVVPPMIRDIYARKAVASVEDVRARLAAYVAHPEEVDAPHRSATFSVSHPDLAASEGAQRIERLLKIVADNAFWR